MAPQTLKEPVHLLCLSGVPLPSSPNPPVHITSSALLARQVPSRFTALPQSRLLRVDGSQHLGFCKPDLISALSALVLSLQGFPVPSNSAG